MLLRPKLAGLLSALAASVALLLSGCSSSSPRDLNYGNDTGVGFVPPDGGPSATLDAGIDGGGSVDSSSAVDAWFSADNVGDGVEASVTVNAGIDAGTDAPIDTAIDASFDGDD
jgi:hypothetical protein